MSPDLIACLYLASGVLFILSLRGLSSPASSRQGNFFALVNIYRQLILFWTVYLELKKGSIN